MRGAATYLAPSAEALCRWAAARAAERRAAAARAAAARDSCCGDGRRAAIKCIQCIQCMYKMSRMATLYNSYPRAFPCFSVLFRAFPRFRASPARCSRSPRAAVPPLSPPPCPPVGSPSEEEVLGLRRRRRRQRRRQEGRARQKSLRLLFFSFCFEPANWANPENRVAEIKERRT